MTPDLFALTSRAPSAPVCGRLGDAVLNCFQLREVQISDTSNFSLDQDWANYGRRTSLDRPVCKNDKCTCIFFSLN